MKKNKLNKKQTIIISVVAVVVIAILVLLIVLISGGKKNVQQALPTQVLTVRTARLADHDPVMSEVAYTFVDGKISKVKQTDTYNETEIFKASTANFFENTEKYQNVTSNEEKRTITYDLKDISEWADSDFESLKSKYEADLNWNIVVDNTTGETTENNETTESATSAEK